MPTANTAQPARAGAARVNVDPPTGLDLVGYLRRWQPSSGNGQPLEINVLVTEHAGERTAVVSLDAPSVVSSYALRMRAAVARAIGCHPTAVMVNASHTHSAPPLPGHLKTGGSTCLLRPEEERYAEALIDHAAATAAQAAAALRPCRIGYGVDSFDGGVNRRQRTADGGTIMGWNPEGPRDPEVSVIRVDAVEGDPIATVVVYACHPTVLGPDILTSSSDFVGPLRQTVRQMLGGVCLFLQGTAGNIFPLQAVYDEVGAEVEFGRQLGRSALRAWDRADPVIREPVQTPYRSSVDVALWRLTPARRQHPVATTVVERPVELPLQDLVTAAEMRQLGDGLRAELNSLRKAGAPRERWNPVWLHIAWADRMEARIAAGETTTTVRSSVYARLLGHVLIIALPCEPFCEIGLELKQTFDVPTVVLGYTNDMVGYVATAEEYPLGGYEPWIAPRHFDQPCPFDPSIARVLTDAAIEAGREALASH
ncbi:hypothetical protein JYK22_23450, partial [Nonomuraea sp. RK-328]|nr:hypothetical protein [Nonomuraea sp. RK-328]